MATPAGFEPATYCLEATLELWLPALFVIRNNLLMNQFKLCFFHCRNFASISFKLSMA